MESELLIYFEISFFFNPHIVPFIFPIKRSNIYIYSTFPNLNVSPHSCARSVDKFSFIDNAHTTGRNKLF